MDVRQAIEDRRSIRRFLPRDVEQEKIMQLLQAARLAPSAKNRQNWKFMVLRGEVKRQVARALDAALDAGDIEVKNHPKSGRMSAHVMGKAPVVLLAFLEMDEEWRDGDMLSLGGAMEHICLRAMELGLGTVWVRDTMYAGEEICRIVGHPELFLVTALVVGYPDQEPPMRPRKTLEEIILPAPEQEE